MLASLELRWHRGRAVKGRALATFSYEFNLISAFFYFFFFVVFVCVSFACVSHLGNARCKFSPQFTGHAANCGWAQRIRSCLHTQKTVAPLCWPWHLSWLKAALDIWCVWRGVRVQHARHYNSSNNNYSSSNSSSCRRHLAWANIFTVLV